MWLTGELFEWQRLVERWIWSSPDLSRRDQRKWQRCRDRIQWWRQVVGQGGSGRIDKGEYLAIPCQGSSPAVLSRIDAVRREQ